MLNFAAGELLLIDKPLGWTSFDVVSKIRNALNPLRIKIGHAGTLDPLATGLLIICTGKLTKSIEQYQAQVKTYTGTFVLGATRPSYDKETEIDAVYPTDLLNEAQILAVKQQFIGTIMQKPPMYSALKTAGKRAYQKARQGEEVTLAPREISINSFELNRIDLPEIDFKIICSKGTYIRSIVHDYGRVLNNGAYLSALKRTHIGDFCLKDAWSLPDFLQSIQTQAS